MKKEWLWGLLGLLGALGIALGYTTPGSRLTAHEDRITTVERESAATKTDVAVLKTDVRYIRDGMDELLGRRRPR